LDYQVYDKEGLLAQGDNNMLWAEIDHSRYEEARRDYALLLQQYGWEDPIVERMLRYFIKTDNLKQVLPLQQYFMANPAKHKIGAYTLAELGGYLLTKRTQKPVDDTGNPVVPNPYLDQIGGIRDVLLLAVREDPILPEAHYNLARYYNMIGSQADEFKTLKVAVKAFDQAREESSERTADRLQAERRYAAMLTDSRQFFPAENELVKAAGIYENAVARSVLARAPEFGRIYADLGDLEYFTKDGDMARALDYYLKGEQNGWAPPEIQYRIGAAYYFQKQWGPAMDRFFAVSTEVPANRRLLNALGNAAYMRGDYFAAQGYLNRLLDMLTRARAYYPPTLPRDRPELQELAERLMVARNNLGVTLDALADTTGKKAYRSQALGLYTMSSQAWDQITRNPVSMVRPGSGSLSTPGVNLGYLNSRNDLYPQADYRPQLYLQIDKDVLEPSPWEKLTPPSYHLSDAAASYT
jgi:tetratricopeptide (TPR) repeat protein